MFPKYEKKKNYYHSFRFCFLENVPLLMNVISLRSLWNVCNTRIKPCVPWYGKARSSLRQCWRATAVIAVRRIARARATEIRYFSLHHSTISYFYTRQTYNHSDSKINATDNVEILITSTAVNKSVRNALDNSIALIDLQWTSK